MAEIENIGVNSTSQSVENEVIVDSNSKKLTPILRDEIKQMVGKLREEKKLKRVFAVVVDGDEYDDKPIYVGYFIRPNFAQFSMYMNMVQKDIAQASKILAQACMVGGDKELVEDDDLFLYGLMNHLTILVQGRSGELVK